MSERPIIFSGPMVKALLDGRKTQTRRAAYGPWIASPDMDSETQEHFDVLGHIFNIENGSVLAHAAPTPWASTKAGDRLWVREAWAHDAPSLGECRAAHEDAMSGRMYGPYYRATEVAPDTLRWRPSIHMPRWASRLTLVVTDVRAQPLQEISEGDALAEGIARCDFPYDSGEAREAFARLWDHLYGAGAFASNPLVVAITFDAHRCNINAMKAGT